MQMTIVSYMVYQLTKDPLTLGMIGLCEVIPAIGFSIISGHFVDQKEKRTLFMWCVVGFMALALYYLLLAQPSIQKDIGVKYTVWGIYFGVFIGGILRAFGSPANFALLSLIVPKKLYANATTWSSTVWQLGAVLGPLFAGLIMAGAGFQISLIVVFFVKGIALWGILRIKRKPIMQKKKEAIFNSLKARFKFCFQNPNCISRFSTGYVCRFVGGAVALLPIYATDILNVGEVGFGWLRAAPGIGAILTLMILSFLPLQKKAGKKLLACIAGYGVTIIIFGVSDIFALSFAMLLLGGMFDAVSVVIRMTILQLHTPDEMRGRVAAVNTMFISSSNELGAAESGFTAKLMGTVRAVVFGGIMTIGVVATTYFKAPKLRKLEFD